MILTYKPDFKSPRPFACDSAARILAAMAFLRSSGEASGMTDGTRSKAMGRCFTFHILAGPFGLGGSRDHLESRR